MATDTETAAAISSHNTAANGHTTRGNTAGRPASPTVGDVYINTENGVLEIYESTGWGPIISPSIVTSVSATNSPSGRAYNNGRASVAFTPGTFAGTTYTVTSSPGSYTASGSSSPVLITGLQSSTQYTYTVIALSKYGASPTSSASTGVTATTVPQAPTIDSVTGGNAQVSVAFTAGATGGSTITGFTVTSSPGSLTASGASSPLVVTGLTNNTAYTFTATATNTNGTSAASAASSSATPTQPPIVADYLIVAGGGGGASRLGGGGGAGGYRYFTSQNLTYGSPYVVTVGNGGPGGINPQDGNSGTKGSNSSFNNNSATGGGFGGINVNGGPGGSGGGAGFVSSPGSGNEGGYNPSEGNSGGTASNADYKGGGGGGIGGSGTQSAGGAGTANSISGTSVTYAVGGGPRNYGANANGANGGVNTGGGGEAGGGNGPAGVGGSGGSGIVIISSSIVAASTTGSPDYTTSGGSYIYKFTATGSITF